jgi:hypothetical protein
MMRLHNTAESSTPSALIKTPKNNNVEIGFEFAEYTLRMQHSFYVLCIIVQSQYIIAKRGLK